MNIETVEWATWLSDVYGGRKHEATIVGLTGIIRSILNFKKICF